jgi:hypothetical protein
MSNQAQIEQRDIQVAAKMGLRCYGKRMVNGKVRLVFAEGTPFDWRAGLRRLRLERRTQRYGTLAVWVGIGSIIIAVMYCMA